MDEEKSNKGPAQPGRGERETFAKHAAPAVLGALGAMLLIVLIGWIAPPGAKHSWADIILAVVTGAYVLVTYFQWSTLRESIRVADQARAEARGAADAQLKEARRANELSLRAWLVIENVELSGIGYPNRPTDIDVRVHVHNAGKIPALSVAVTLEVDIVPSDTPLTVSSLFVGHIVIPANHLTPFAFTIRGMSTADISDMRGVGARSRAFGVRAQLTYTDALKTDGTAAQGAVYLRGTDEYREAFVLDREDIEIT